jgi:hypothetical protein
MSRGVLETELLRETIQGQLGRLLTQLEDLEELRDEFSVEEYEELRSETHQQLREFQEFLSRSLSGNMSLVNEFDAAQIAIQAAVSRAFKTPEVIRLFAEKQPEGLRLHLNALQVSLDLKFSLRTLS